MKRYYSGHMNALEISIQNRHSLLLIQKRHYVIRIQNGTNYCLRRKNIKLHNYSFHKQSPIQSLLEIHVGKSYCIYMYHLLML